MANIVTDIVTGKPMRIQRKRTKGYSMPGNTVSVTRPGRWGNPYAVKQWLAAFVDGRPITQDDRDAALAAAVADFQRDVLEELAHNPDYLAPLRGKNLACYGPPGATYHGNVLLELANWDQWLIIELLRRCWPCACEPLGK